MLTTNRTQLNLIQAILKKKITIIFNLITLTCYWKGVLFDFFIYILNFYRTKIQIHFKHFV